MRVELRAMLRLSAPVILAELAWILMGIVDTIIVAPLGPAAIGAVGTGSTIFFAVMVFGMGTLFALDAFISQAFGAGRIDECRRWVAAGLHVAVGLSVLLVALGLAGLPLLGRVGVHEDVLALLEPYLAALWWSAPPLLVFTVFRRYLQALHVAGAILTIVVAANVVNAVGNWALVFGHLGAPALGVTGSAYATLGARVFMTVALGLVILRRERGATAEWRALLGSIDVARMRRLVTLGVPSALQLMLEVGVFAAMSLLASSISPLAVAANQIVLNLAAFVFMVPLGLSSAAAVRVGHAVGRGDRRGARLAGWLALGLGWIFAVLTSAAFLLAPGALLGIFTSDPGLLPTAVVVLMICAGFLPFDTSQVIMTGALRGLGETRWPMLLNLVGHWGIGLPLAWVLCFTAGWGVAGLWMGLAVGIILIGVGVTTIWARMSRSF